MVHHVSHSLDNFSNWLSKGHFIIEKTNQRSQLDTTGYTQRDSLYNNTRVKKTSDLINMVGKLMRLL